MSLRNIRKIGDDILRKRAREVTEIDDRIKELLTDMAETMYANDGVGLAAPQVGVLRRVVTIDVGEGLIELINPVIESRDGEQINYEGCLSVPTKIGEVKRPNRLKVSALNRNGKPFKFIAEGFLARAVCHELDHLDGVLFVDKAISISDKDEATE